jgi:hypothetical protein
MSGWRVSSVRRALSRDETIKEDRMRKWIYGLAATGFVAAMALAPLSAHAPSGAIFTTVADGSEVNFNIYPSKEAVYLDGGPGPGAPQTAAGLDDGYYIFQVTDPPGKVLLSTDNAGCRRFHVSNGIIDAYAPTQCNTARHLTGTDVDHGAVTIQLMPYNDTPNNGGVYKVWVTFESDYGCNLNKVDCHIGKHGFTPAHSKTDNFKVRTQNQVPVEIDTRFFRDANGDGIFQWGEEFIDGLSVTWFDTNNASNTKFSMWAPEINVNHEAHVEAVENGIHTIRLQNQPGCTIGGVHVDGQWAPFDGPQDVAVNVQSDGSTELTVFIDVGCLP